MKLYEVLTGLTDVQYPNNFSSYINIFNTNVRWAKTAIFVFLAVLWFFFGLF
jgi:hypothetical protein